jgi:hypothetical protein
LPRKQNVQTKHKSNDEYKSMPQLLLSSAVRGMGRKVETGVDNMYQWWDKDTTKQLEKE